MEDPMTNCLVPHSLCMRPASCEYCQQPDTRYVTIDHLFGIISCDAHYDWALRDCRAYMHLNGIVLLRDAKKVDILSALIEELIAKNTLFHIKRTSGVIETGWSVLDEAYDYPSLQNLEGKWSVHVTNGKVRKFVPLEEFILYGDLSAESVVTATDVLDKGIYLDEYEKQMLLAVEANHVTEVACVGMGIMANGSLVRVLSPR
jgi:hypothetical protein